MFTGSFVLSGFGLFGYVLVIILSLVFGSLYVGLGLRLWACVLILFLFCYIVFCWIVFSVVMIMIGFRFVWVGCLGLILGCFLVGLSFRGWIVGL